MAKEDFCFTYYDGDAARDKSHLTRLQRGAYDDMISAQRKFGHLTDIQIKRVLGKDYEDCWEALEWVLLKDDDGKFYIEWVEKSVERAKRFAMKQVENGKRGGRPKKEEKNPNETQTKPNDNPNHKPNESQKKPLEDEHVYEDEELFFPDKTLHGKELDETDFDLTIVYVEATTRKKVDAKEVERMWKAFKIQYFNGEKAYKDWSEIIQHFRDWLKNQVSRNKSVTIEATENIGLLGGRKILSAR